MYTFADEIFDFLMGQEDVFYSWKPYDVMVIEWGLMFSLNAPKYNGFHVKICFNPTTGIYDIEVLYPNYATKTQIGSVADWGIVNITTKLLRGEPFQEMPDNINQFGTWK